MNTPQADKSQAVFESTEPGPVYFEQTPSRDPCFLTTVPGPERYRRKSQQRTQTEHLEEQKKQIL